MASSAHLHILPMLSKPRQRRRQFHWTTGYRSRDVEFTHVRYNVQRLGFAAITTEDMAFFNDLLPGCVVTDPDILEASNVDWLRTMR
eukprot:g33411.t1